MSAAVLAAALVAIAIAGAALEAYIRRNRPPRRLSDTQPKASRGWLDMPEHHAQRPARVETKGPRG